MSNRGVVKKTHRSGNVTWRFRYSYHGELRERPALSEADAIKKYDDAQVLMSHNLDPDLETGYRGAVSVHKTPLVSTIIDEYLEKLRPEHDPKDPKRTFQQLQADRAFGNSNGYANRLKAKFRHDANGVDLVALRSYARSRTAGHGTINHEFDFLRAAFRYYIRAHPEASKVLPAISWADARLKHSEKPRDRRTTDEEITELVKKLPDFMALMPAFAVETILRASEISQIEWEDVRGNNLILPAHKTKGKKKARTIPLTSRALTILAVQKASGSAGLIFRTPENFHTYWRLSIAMKESGTGITFHDLRHEAASRFVENGGDIRSLMEVGGWSSMSMVTRYSHVNTERAREVMERGSSSVVAIKERA